jgi:His/Glu/Gln/Arg/opine family amino acid ABC transporter permease subunit
MFDGWGDTVATEVPLFLDGLRVTLELLLVSTAVGMVLAVPLALARVSRSRILSVPATAYTYAFRGTPLLVQIFLIYYGLPQFEAVRGSAVWPLLRDPMPCALLAFSLNMSAYVAEVLRGGILGVPHGEREAALALGMPHALMVRRIVLPRAFRITLPALSNEVVLQLKATALASTVTLLDLTGVGRRLTAKTYTTEALFVAGAIYIVLTMLLAQGFRLLEGRLNHERRS